VASVPPAPRHVWDYRRWRVARDPNAACLSYLMVWHLPPGRSISSRELEVTVLVRDVLGDSLPAGRYRISAGVGYNSQASGGVLAGEVDLRTRQQ
jgi:hypothetical protein